MYKMNKIKILLHEFTIKRNQLEKQCYRSPHSEGLSAWFDNHDKELSKFITQINEILNPISTPLPYAASGRSVKTKSSSSSKVSSARIKLAEQKAKLKTEKEMKEKFRKIEEKELQTTLQLKHEREQLETEKAEKELNNLEDELNEIENSQHLSSDDESSLRSFRSSSENFVPANTN